MPPLDTLRLRLRRFAGGTYRSVRSTVSRRLFERGPVDTSEKVELRDLGIDEAGREAYEPSGWFFLRRTLRRSDVGPDDVFVDIGSGMGRVVYMAARDYPFRRAMGVEIAEDLNERARINIAHNRDRLKCRDVEFITADALTYQLPDDVTVVYMFNPFGGEIFERVLREILDSVDRAPRALRLIYGNPMMEESVVRTGRFQMDRRVKMRRRKTPFERPWLAVYTALPAARDPQCPTG